MKVGPKCGRPEDLDLAMMVMRRLENHESFCSSFPLMPRTKVVGLPSIMKIKIIG